MVEADMNATLKIIWNHRLVPTAEKTKFLSPVQFGNRKGRTACLLLLHDSGINSSAPTGSGTP
eukprot:14544138-Ditylum_brightwellii.AAC.1